jgi:hypothetical protein
MSKRNEPTVELAPLPSEVDFDMRTLVSDAAACAAAEKRKAEEKFRNDQAVEKRETVGALKDARAEIVLRVAGGFNSAHINVHVSSERVCENVAAKLGLHFSGVVRVPSIYTRCIIDINGLPSLGAYRVSK